MQVVAVAAPTHLVPVVAVVVDPNRQVQVAAALAVDYPNPDRQVVPMNQILLLAPNLDFVQPLVEVVVPQPIRHLVLPVVVAVHPMRDFVVRELEVLPMLRHHQQCQVRHPIDLMVLVAGLVLPSLLHPLFPGHWHHRRLQVGPMLQHPTVLVDLVVRPVPERPGLVVPNCYPVLEPPIPSLVEPSALEHRMDFVRILVHHSPVRFHLLPEKRLGVEQIRVQAHLSNLAEVHPRNFVQGVRPVRNQLVDRQNLVVERSATILSLVAAVVQDRLPRPLV